MNPIHRLLRCANAYIGLKGPHPRTEALTSNSVQSIRTAFDYCKGFFFSMQADEKLVRYEKTEVQHFWDELKPTVRHREYAYRPHSFCGIGVVEL